MDKTITLKDGRLFYRDEGKGLPVVLIHGFAEDGEVWNAQIEALKNTYRVIVPDLPGSRRSEVSTNSADNPAASIESMAETIAALLDHENITQAVLIGHSMGGYITLAVAEKYPERLKGFGLFHSTAYADSEEKKANRRKSNEFMRKNGAEVFIRQSTPNLFSPNNRETHPEWVSAMIDRYVGFSAESLIAWYEAMIARPDRRKVLETAKCPVLFVIGEQDQAVPPQQALEQSHLPTISHIHILTRSGHLGMLEEADKSSRILLSFLKFVSHS